MKYVLQKLVGGKNGYWNTCGWTDRASHARKFTQSDAMTAKDRMTPAEFGVLIRAYDRGNVVVAASHR